MHKWSVNLKERVSFNEPGVDGQFEIEVEGVHPVVCVTINTNMVFVTLQY
jgi:hypothetical protein